MIDLAAKVKKMQRVCLSEQEIAFRFLSLWKVKVYALNMGFTLQASGFKYMSSLKSDFPVHDNQNSLSIVFQCTEVNCTDRFNRLCKTENLHSGVILRHLKKIK
jgi:hypothetical protein